MILLTYIVLFLIIATDAVADGLLDKKKQRSHGTELLNVVMWLAAIPLFKVINVSFIYIAMLYICIRIYAFNPIYNITRHLPIFYRGNTDIIFDVWLKKIPLIGYATIQMLALFLSIVISAIIWI